MNLPKISSARLKSIRSLNKKSYRAETGMFLVEGPKLVSDAMQAGWHVAALLCTTESLGHSSAHALIRKAEDNGVEVFQCAPKDMAYVSATEQSQGMLAVVRQKNSRPADIPFETGHIVLALDGLQDPGNVGTCIRSADWFGAVGVLLGEGCASVYNEKTVRASAGSIFHIPCVEGVDLVRELSDLATRGYQIAGADALGMHPYTDLADQRRRVLVLGSEASGISEGVRTIMHVAVSIPRRGQGDSLNVSIAGSIIMAHLSHSHGSGEL